MGARDFSRATCALGGEQSVDDEVEEGEDAFHRIAVERGKDVKPERFHREHARSQSSALWRDEETDHASKDHAESETDNGVPRFRRVMFGTLDLLHRSSEDEGGSAEKPASRQERGGEIVDGCSNRALADAEHIHRIGMARRVEGVTCCYWTPRGSRER